MGKFDRFDEQEKNTITNFFSNLNIVTSELIEDKGGVLHSNRFLPVTINNITNNGYVYWLQFYNSGIKGFVDEYPKLLKLMTNNKIAVGYYSKQHLDDSDVLQKLVPDLYVRNKYNTHLSAQADLYESEGSTLTGISYYNILLSFVHNN